MAALGVILKISARSARHAANFLDVDPQGAETDIARGAPNSLDTTSKDLLQKLPHRDSRALGALRQRHPLGRSVRHFWGQIMDMRQQLSRFARIEAAFVSGILTGTPVQRGELVEFDQAGHDGPRRIQPRGQLHEGDGAAQRGGSFAPFIRIDQRDRITLAGILCRDQASGDQHLAGRLAVQPGLECQRLHRVFAPPLDRPPEQVAPDADVHALNDIIAQHPLYRSVIAAFTRLEQLAIELTEDREVVLPALSPQEGRVL